MKKMAGLLAAVLAGACGPPPKPARWGTPVQLAPGREAGVITDSPQVAADGRGRAMAVWAEQLPTSPLEYRVRLSTYEPRNGWTAAQTIAAGYAHPIVRLAMNEAGEAILATSVSFSLTVLRFLPGSGWVEPRSIGDGLVGSGRVAIGEDGSAVVLWVQPAFGPAALHALRFAPASGWGTEDVISAVVAPARYGSGVASIRAAMDALGNAIALWTQFPERSLVTLWSNHAVAGSGWGTPRRLRDALSHVDVDVAMNAEGTAIAVWRSLGLRASRFRGGVWSAPALIAMGKSYDCCPRVAIGEAGDATALWLNWAEGGPPAAVEAIRAGRDGGWGEPQSLPVADARLGQAPYDFPGGVVLDRYGNATAVWNGEQLVAYRYEVGRGWGQPQEIGGAWAFSEVKVAIDRAGDVFAVWTAQDGTWANRLEVAPE